MEKKGLSTESQQIVDSFAKFREKYSNLETLIATQTEYIALQKMELENMNRRIEQLTSALSECRRHCNVTICALRSENERLQRIVEDFQQQRTNSHFRQELDDERVNCLKEEVSKLRCEITSVRKDHENQVLSLKKRHEEEISVYKKRHVDETNKNKEDEIAIGTQSLKMLRKKRKYTRKESGTQQATRNAPSAHPAFDTEPEVKKKAPNESRWPQLNIIIGKEIKTEGQKIAQPMRKKKLFHEDNDTIVDLTF